MTQSLEGPSWGQVFCPVHRAAWLLWAHSNFIANLLECLPSSLRYSDISFRLDTATFKYNFIQAMVILFFAFFFQRKHMKPTGHNWPIYTIVLLVFMSLSKGEIRILPVPGSWGEMEICIKTLTINKFPSLGKLMGYCYIMCALLWFIRMIKFISHIHRGRQK